MRTMTRHFSWVLPWLAVLCMVLPTSVVGVAGATTPPAPRSAGGTLATELAGRTVFPRSAQPPPSTSSGVGAVHVPPTVGAPAMTLPTSTAGKGPTTTPLSAPSFPKVAGSAHEPRSNPPSLAVPAAISLAPSRETGPLITSAPTPTWSQEGTVPVDMDDQSSFAYGASLVYDAYDHYTLFVGLDQATGQMETWAYREGGWTNLTATQTYALPAGEDLGMAYDGADQYVVLFDSGTWVFENGQWAPSSPASSPPLGLEQEGLTYDAQDGYVVLFGGSYCQGASCPTLNITWTYRGGVWTNITASAHGAPSPRTLPSMAYDGGDHYVLLFGGESTSGSSLGDTYKFVGGRWTLLYASSGPIARYQAPATYDPTDGYVLLFGGSGCPTNDPGACADTWKFTGGAWSQWFPATSPQQELGVAEAMDFDQASGYVVLLEGPYASGSSNANDSVYWDWPAPLQADLSSPTPSVDANQTLSLATAASGGAPGYSYSWTGLPAGCSGANSPYLNCTPTLPASLTISATVTDASGRTVVSSLDVPVWKDPSLAAPQPSIPRADLGIPVSFTAPTSGGSGGFTYTWTTPNGVGCSASTSSTISCVPQSIGAYRIWVDGQDSDGYPASSPQTSFQIFTGLSVTLAENRTHLDLGEPIFFWANATGGTGVYTFTYNGLPAGCVSANSSTLACVPQTGSSGGGVTVSVTDTGGGMAGSAPVAFAVSPDPVFSSSWFPGSWVRNQSGTWLSYLNATGTYQTNFTGGTPNYNYCLYTVPSTSYALCSGWTGSTTFAWGMLFMTNSGMTTGTYTLIFSAEDSTGWNDTVRVTLRLFYPTSVGAISLKAPVDQGGVANLSAYISHGATPVFYWWNNTRTGTQLCAPRSLSTSARVFCQFPVSAGTNWVTLFTRDALGEMWNSTLLFSPPAPPAPAFTVLPQQVLVGQSFAVEGQTTGGSSPFEMCIQFAAGIHGSCAKPGPETYRWFNLTFATTGTFMVGLSVVDAAGVNITAWSNVTVFPLLAGLGGTLPSWTYEGSALSLSLAWTGGLTPFSIWLNDTNTSTEACAAHAITFEDFSCEITADWLGNHTFLATVRDPGGESASFSWFTNSYLPLQILTIWVSSGPANSTQSSLALELGGPVYLNASFQGGAPGNRHFQWSFGGVDAGIIASGNGTEAIFDVVWVPEGLATSPMNAFTLEFELQDSEGTQLVQTFRVHFLPSISSLALASSVARTDLGLSVNLTATFQFGTGPFHFAWLDLRTTPGSVLGSSDVPYFVWSPPTLGTFELEVMVEDAYRGSAMAVVNVTVDPDPSAYCLPIATSTILETGSLVNLTLPCAEGGTLPYTFVWSFGDAQGGSGTVPSASHRYTAPGTYQVWVRVADAVGLEAVSHTLNLTIAPAPGPTGGGPPGTGLSNEDVALLIFLVVAAAIVLALLLARRGRKEVPSSGTEGRSDLPPGEVRRRVESEAKELLQEKGPQKEPDLVAAVAGSTGASIGEVQTLLRAMVGERVLLQVPTGATVTYHLAPDEREVEDEAELRRIAEGPQRVVETVRIWGPIGLAEICRRADMSREEVMVLLIQLQKEAQVLLLPRSGEGSDPVYDLGPRARDREPEEDGDDPGPLHVDEAMVQDFLTRREAEVGSVAEELDPEDAD